MANATPSGDAAMQNPPGVAVTAATPPEALLAQLVGEISAEADLQADELKTMRRPDRLTFGDQVWRVLESPPGNDKLLIVAMFGHDRDNDEASFVPGDVRIYMLPRSSVSPESFNFFCYTLNRAHPTSLREAMIRSAFVATLADEYQSLAVAQGILEEDDGLGGETTAGNG